MPADENNEASKKAERLERFRARQQERENKELRIAQEEKAAKKHQNKHRTKEEKMRAFYYTLSALFMGAMLFFAFLYGEDPATLEMDVTLAAADVEELQQAAGCELLVDGEPLADDTTVDAADIEPDDVYTSTRPTHSGPAPEWPHPVLPRARTPINEISSTRNLSNGSIIVWYDEDDVTEELGDEMGEWAELLNQSGFGDNTAGVGIMTSPYEPDPGISSGQTFAFRAWGVAMDCDEWDEQVAYAFVGQHFGPRGDAPDGSILRYPASPTIVLND